MEEPCIIFFPALGGVNKLFFLSGVFEILPGNSGNTPPARGTYPQGARGGKIARGSGVLESDSRSLSLWWCCACCRQAGSTLTKNIYIPRGKQTVLIDDCSNHIFLMRARERAQTIMLCQYYKLFVVRVFPANDEFDAAPPEIGSTHTHTHTRLSILAACFSASRISSRRLFAIQIYLFDAE